MILSSVLRESGPLDGDTDTVYDVTQNCFHNLIHYHPIAKAYKIRRFLIRWIKYLLMAIVICQKNASIEQYSLHFYEMIVNVILLKLKDVL